MTTLRVLTKSTAQLRIQRGPGEPIEMHEIAYIVEIDDAVIRRRLVPSALYNKRRVSKAGPIHVRITKDRIIPLAEQAIS